MRNVRVVTDGEAIGAEVIVPEVSDEFPEDYLRSEDKSFPVCVVCGDPLPKGARKYCTRHKGGLKARTTPKRTPRKATRSASSDEWYRFLSVIIIAFTWLIGRSIAGGKAPFFACPEGINPDEFEELVDFYAMTDEEVEPISTLIASRMVGTGLNKRVGKYIVRSLEYEDVGYALWSYAKRVGPPLSTKIHKPKEKRVRTNGTPQPATNGKVVLGPADFVRIARERQRIEAPPENSN